MIHREGAKGAKNLKARVFAGGFIFWIEPQAKLDAFCDAAELRLLPLAFFAFLAAHALRGSIVFRLFPT